jgi:hypothetical protein
MSYLDRLKKSANTGAGTLKNQNNPETEGFLGSLGTPPAPFQKIEGATAANDPGQKRPVAHAAEALTAWVLHFTDREPMEVWFWPVVSHDEALAAYPDAVAAEPIRQQEPPRSCRTCRHLRRPGLSDGHCGGRDDLPPAYTAGHPLRRLPDDGGASCTTWEESR